ncbi:hypothetical protein LTR66_008172 [Elasticomyces elasticus]|nr:hypothetical protein LTR66_008172 [Elasticomyces elasticus]KAK5005247.1 hypothetical protein LTR28_007951 [Elasticomyces elasticus]
MSKNIVADSKQTRQQRETENDLPTTTGSRRSSIYVRSKESQSPSSVVHQLTTPRSEHIEQSKKRNSAVPSSSLASPRDKPTSPPVRIPGISYKDINFNGSAYSRSLIKKLSYLHLAKLATLMALGYRTQAISILGTHVMAARGLVGLAKDSLDVCTAEVLALFTVLAEPANYPLLVHCTQGKDRTGLTVLLLLMLYGVSAVAIGEDYLRSESELAPEREEKLREVRSIGLPDEFAGCPPHWVDEVCGYVEERYGGVEEYLARCGVTEQMREAVKQNLCCQSSDV